MKKIIRYISEIIFSIVLIFISYFVWDRIDVKAYEKYITQYTLEDIQISMENNFDNLFYLSNEKEVEDTVIYVNNYQNKIYNVDILLVLTGINDTMMNDLYLNINGENYSLNNIYKTHTDDDYYFLISNIVLNEYEKRNYNLKLLLSDDFDFTNFSSFSYKIQKEIKG